MLHLDYRDARPIYTQIIDGIREQIVSGLLLTGERLPSVRELATSLAINPNTIQRAYRELEADGWIATVPGKGCFVSAAADTQQRERDRLLHSLDETVCTLESLGMSRAAIAAHIRKEDV